MTQREADAQRRGDEVRWEVISRYTAKPLFPKDLLRLGQATVYGSRAVEDLNCQVGSCFEVHSWLKSRG